MTERFINNRYKIIQKLGKGGMGEVFLVEDILHQKTVALKTIRKKILHSSTISKLKNEFEVMTRLKHPNLARVYDFSYDEENENYFITMEYMNGINLREWVETQSPQRFEKEILDIFVTLLRATEFIHSRNILHRDIKPENIMIMNNEELTMNDETKNNSSFFIDHSSLKLMDFGLSDFEDSQKRETKGTLLYFAPEILDGVISEKVDIFALGVTLYELLTGEPLYGEASEFPQSSSQPTKRKSATTQTLFQILQDSDYFYKNQAIALENISDTSLRSIIERMTAFNPDLRYDSCTEVIADINGKLGKDYPLETEQTQEAYVLGAGFVGREEEFASLKKRLAKKDAGRQLLRVYGDAGIGKTRLFEEFKHYCQLHNIAFLQGNCEPIAQQNFGAFLPILSECLLNSSQELLDKYGENLKIILPDHKSLKNFNPTEIDDPKTKQKVLIQTITNFLIEYSAQSNSQTVLFFNDMHWADDSSIAALEELMYKLNEQLKMNNEELKDKSNKNSSLFITHSSLRVYVSSRPGNLGNLSKIKEKKRLIDLELHPFDESNVKSYIQAVFGEKKFDDSLLNAIPDINRKVGGNPFFLQELIKSLVTNQLITRRPHSWQLTQSIENTEIPNTLKDLISSRLKTLNLTEHEMKILQILALLNYSPTYRELSEIISFDASLLERFENLELIKSRIVEDAIVYETVHAITREVVMESAKDQPALHQLIAEKLEEIHSDNLQAYISELAYHYAQAGNREKALPYLERAADDAKENYQNEAAITFYDQLLEWLDDDQIEKRIDVLLDKSRVLYTIGERDKCQQVRAGALSLSKEIANSKLIAKSNYFLGIIFTDKGNYEKALEYYKSSLKIYEHLSDKKGKSEILSRLGNLYYLKGERDKATKTLKKSLDICEETKQKRIKSIVLSVIGDIYEEEGNYDSAMKCFEEGLSISREIDNQIGIASALGKIAGLYWTKSKYDLATHYYKKQLKIAKQLGDKSHIARAFFHLGNIDLFKERTDFNSAMNHYKESLKICQELGNKDFISKALNGIANIYWGKGHYEKAIEFYNRNIEIIKEVGNIKSIFITVGNLGLIHFDKKDYDKAIDYFDQAIKAHRELNFKYGLTYWLWGKGECLYEKNEPQKAKNLAIECIDLSEDISKPDTIYNAKLLLAKCNYDLGETEKAVKQFNEMLNHTRNDDEIATIHYYLWTFTQNEKDGKIALDLYKELYNQSPSIKYKNRIDELMAIFRMEKEETNFDDEQIEDLDESLIL